MVAGIEGLAGGVGRLAPALHVTSTGCYAWAAVASVSKAFANDVLLALSCREAGCVLITSNDRDVARIRRFVPFQFISPLPGRMH